MLVTGGWTPSEDPAVTEERLALFEKGTATLTGASYQPVAYDALAASQIGWHNGTDDPVPFIKYLLCTILAAYRDFGDRFALVETKRSALDTVRLAVQNKIGRFTKQDIRELCPSLSLSSVEGSLRKMVEDGELKREGKGKGTFYLRK